MRSWHHAVRDMSGKKSYGCLSKFCLRHLKLPVEQVNLHVPEDVESRSFEHVQDDRQDRATNQRWLVAEKSRSSDRNCRVPRVQYDMLHTSSALYRPGEICPLGFLPRAKVPSQWYGGVLTRP